MLLKRQSLEIDKNLTVKTGAREVVNPPEVVVEPGSEVCRTGVSDFDAVFFGVDSELGGFVGEGDLVWKDFEGVGDGEKASSGKELGKEPLKICRREYN